MIVWVSNSLLMVFSSSSISRSSNSADVFSLFSRSARSVSSWWRFLIAFAVLSSGSSSESPASLKDCIRNFFRLYVIRSVWS